MTIRFLQPWAGYEVGQVATIADIEQGLIDAGLAVEYVPAVVDGGLVRWKADEEGGVYGTTLPSGSVFGATLEVDESRELTLADNGRVLELITDDLDLTIPAGLSGDFRCVLLPTATTTIVPAVGVTLNGATDSVVLGSGTQRVVHLIGTATLNYFVVG